MPKLTFHWNSVPKLITGAEVHKLVPKLFRAEVTRAEHRLPHFWLWKLILVVEMLRTRTTESVVLRQNKRPQWDTACLRVLANFTAKLFFRPNRLNLDNSSERGVFFYHSHFSTKETKLKIKIYLSRAKASGLSEIPSVTSNVPKNAVPLNLKLWTLTQGPWVSV